MRIERKLGAEFIGTFFLVLVVGLATRSAGSLAPLAIGATLMVMVFAGGHISGGHYNPAVSTAVMLRGKLSRRDWLAYLVTQLVAGCAAAGVVAALGYSFASPMKTAGIGSMLVAEFLFTFALCYVVLNVATARDTEGNSFYGLAIGSTVGLGALAVGSISGGAFNPAVALGATLMGVLTWSHIWIYLVAELLGGAVAAAAFLLTQQSAVEEPVRPRLAEDGEGPTRLAA
jgi:aquaporin Z